MRPMEWQTEHTTAPPHSRGVMLHAALQCSLGAFEEDNKLIPPTKYNTKLCSATAEVHFTYLHVFIKKTRDMLVHHLLKERHRCRRFFLPLSNTMFSILC